VSTVTDTPPTRRRDQHRPKLSDRARAERALGWKLAGPAFVIMLAVTAYPILQAVWLSFFRYRLTDPDSREFIFLSNYSVIFTDPLFYQALWNTVFITVVTVAVELVLGFAIAMLMHRIVLPRRTPAT